MSHEQELSGIETPIFQSNPIKSLSSLWLSHMPTWMVSYILDMHFLSPNVILMRGTKDYAAIMSYFHLASIAQECRFRLLPKNSLLNFKNMETHQPSQKNSVDNITYWNWWELIPSKFLNLLTQSIGFDTFLHSVKNILLVSEAILTLIDPSLQQTWIPTIILLLNGNSIFSKKKAISNLEKGLQYFLPLIIKCVQIMIEFKVKESLLKNILWSK